MSVPADPSATQASAAAVRDTLRELAANLLRVMRGAGRPEDVLRQAHGFIASCAVYREMAGCDPSAESVAEALALELTPDGKAQSEGWTGGENWSDWDRAVCEMVHGGLQVAAAELLAQRSQAAAGRRELFAGYRSIEKIHSRQLGRLLRRARPD